jgi:SGNH hydrolase-like domain, acetyltransferase AlgX
VADVQERSGTLRMRAIGSDPGVASDGPLDLRRRRRLVDGVTSLILGLVLGRLAAPWLHRGWNRFGPGRAVLARVARGMVQVVWVLGMGALLTEVAMRVYHHYMPVFVFPSEGTNRFRGQAFAADYSFHLNSHGFKDVEFEPRKRVGTVRILGLGDSVAFGVVPYEANYLTLLEKDLAGASPPPEVINMGIPGIGPRGYLEVLVNEGLPLHADMVLLSFFLGNDFLDEEPPQPRSYLLAFVRFMFAPKPKGVPIHGSGPYRDDLPNFEPARYMEIERQRAAIFLRTSPVLDDALPGVLSRLERIKRICDGKGLELLMVLIPDEMQVSSDLQAEVAASFPGAAADFDFARVNRRLGAELHALGIPFIDLLGPFQEAGRTTRLYRPRDTHWNIAGNRLGADLIRSELMSGRVRFWKVGNAR